MMGRRLTSLGGEFINRFRAFEHTAFRLETLQRYRMDYEADPLRRFLAGEPPLADPSKDAWCALVRDAVAAGKRMERVHVVIEPLTDYLLYEIVVSYAPNVAAGEDIRIVPVEQGEWPQQLPQNRDYWLLDSSDLWEMVYDGDGRFVYAEHVDDADAVVQANYWRDAALHAGMRYVDYREGLL